MPLHDHESPAALFFDAISKLDFQLAAAQFLPEGQISDEGEDKMIDGRPAIADWLASSQSTYSLTLSAKGSEHREGCLVAKVIARGSFPGSPYEFDYLFVLEGSQIAQLVIRPIGEAVQTD